MPERENGRLMVRRDAAAGRHYRIIAPLVKVCYRFSAKDAKSSRRGKLRDNAPLKFSPPLKVSRTATAALQVRLFGSAWRCFDLRYSVKNGEERVPTNQEDEMSFRSGRGNILRQSSFVLALMAVPAFGWAQHKPSGGGSKPSAPQHSAPAAQHSNTASHSPSTGGSHAGSTGGSHNNTMQGSHNTNAGGTHNNTTGGAHNNTAGGAHNTAGGAHNNTAGGTHNNTMMTASRPITR